MDKLILLFVIFCNNLFAQQKDSLRYYNFSFNNEKSKVIPESKKVQMVFEKDYYNCGRYSKTKSVYSNHFMKMNKILKTDVFNKIQEVNFMACCPKKANKSNLTIKFEEYIFNNSKNALSCFNELKKYKKIKLQKPPIAPLNWLVFIKENRIFILSSEEFHKKNQLQNFYKEAIVSSIFQGQIPEVIEIHK